VKLAYHMTRLIHPVAEQMRNSLAVQGV